MSVTVIVGGPPPPPPPPDDGLRVAKKKPWVAASITLTFDDDATPEEMAHAIEKAQHALARLNE